MSVSKREIDRPISSVSFASSARFNRISVLNTLLPDGGDTSHPVLVIGAGKVGQAAVATLKRKGLKVHVIDRTDLDDAAVADLVVAQLDA